MNGRSGRLAGKAALITGAASGIGRATARLFHAEGAKVAATDRDEAGLAELEGVADLLLAQDVTDEARWREVVDRVVAALGKLDILVNSAGIALKGNIETATLDDFRRTEAVNIDGTFLGCREAIRVMKGSGRRVDRQPVLRRGRHRRRAVGGLLREQGRGQAAHQVRRPPLRPRRLQHPSELGPSLLRRHAHGAAS